MSFTLTAEYEGLLTITSLDEIVLYSQTRITADKLAAWDTNLLNKLEDMLVTWEHEETFPVSPKKLDLAFSVTRKRDKRVLRSHALVVESIDDLLDATQTSLNRERYFEALDDGLSEDEAEKLYPF